MVSYPSGYGTLGVNGGDGKMITGSAAHVLSATTSLTDNLKLPQFKTGYLVNSPPETAPLSGISVPAGWDYTNSYTVVVSKDAFGANGFGGVTIPGVHDSPPKLGSNNLITPMPCQCVVNTADAVGTVENTTTTVSATATAQVCFGTPSQACEITAGSTTATPGGTITFTVANGPGNVLDWVGLYCPTTLADKDDTNWKYLSNSRTAPKTGQTGAVITFTVPKGASTCNARLFADDGYTKLATSPTVTIVK